MPPPTAGAPAAQVRDRLLTLLGPLVAQAGYDLEDITVSAAGRRSMVRVVVDADGGIDLDAVATVSRVVSDTLDAPDHGIGEAGLLAGSYVLEVTSPGIDRPLREQRQWRRATGRLVTVQTKGRTVTGRVEATDGRGVTLRSAAGATEIGWDDLGPGKVQVEFNRSEGE